MLRACLLMLALYAALFYGYYRWLGTMFDPPGVWIGAGVMALVVSGCIGALMNAWDKFRVWRLLQAAAHDLPWSDGRWTAVAGEIHSVVEPVTAPFSGEPCVLCEYDVTGRERAVKASAIDNQTPGSDFTGFLMNPCVVRTRMGDVRLLGFPNLVDFAERECEGRDNARRALQFLATAPHEDFTGMKMIRIISAIKDAWSDDDGLVRKHVRLTKQPPEALFPASLAAQVLGRPNSGPGADSSGASAAGERPLEAAGGAEAADDDFAEDDFEEDDMEGARGRGAVELPILKEKRVKVGQRVCAIGIYNQAKGGLTPAGRGLDRFVRLMRGEIGPVAGQVRSSALAHVVGGLLVLAIANAAAYGVMMAKRYHPVEREKRQRAAIDSVEAGELDQLPPLLARGIDINGQDTRGRTLLTVARTPDAARWLLSHGADVNAADREGHTPLIEAVRHGNDALVKLLLEARADVSRRSADSNLTAAEYAERIGRPDLAEMIRAHGSKLQAEAPAASGEPVP